MIAAEVPGLFSYNLRKRIAAAALVGFLAAIFVWLRTPAIAENFTPFEEIWQKSQIFEPKPSFDTTSVEVRVVSVVYRIPRNYLTLMEPAIPTLKVTFPGFKPLTEETRDCFDRKWQVTTGVCTTFEFLLLGSHGPGPGGRALTNTEKFENLVKLAKTRRPGPFGYDIYEIGPKEARLEIYRKMDGDIFFTCMFSGTEDRARGGVCRDMFRLNDINHAHFFFRSDEIEHVAGIEANIRRLMETFAMGGRQWDQWY